MVLAHNVDELHQVFTVSGLVADIQNILQDHAVYVTVRRWFPTFKQHNDSDI